MRLRKPAEHQVLTVYQHPITSRGVCYKVEDPGYQCRYRYIHISIYSATIATEKLSENYM